MPTEVVATPRAGQQIARLDRIYAKAFGGFQDDLAARGRKALGESAQVKAPASRADQRYGLGTTSASAL